MVKDVVNTKYQRLYMTCFGQAYSPCGKYLAVSNNFGSISLFSIELAISSSYNQNRLNSFFVFTACNCPIYCLKTEEGFLIGGTDDGDILAWKWSELLHKKNILSWSLSVPKNSSSLTIVPEINSIDILNENGMLKLFAGCGDNCVHSWDLNTHKYLVGYRGHNDYIHDIALLKQHQQLVSASEDGTLKIWDLRDSKNFIHSLQPCLDAKVARDHIGKWISFVCLDPNEDWMACGGGVNVCVWHRASLTLTSHFTQQNVTSNCALFYEDKIITGDSNGTVTHWSLAGEKKLEISMSSSNLYNIAINENSKSNKVMTVSGNSEKIDLCTNFSYRALTLQF